MIYKCDSCHSYREVNDDKVVLVVCHRCLSEMKKYIDNYCVKGGNEK